MNILTLFLTILSALVLSNTISYTVQYWIYINKLNQQVKILEDKINELRLLNTYIDNEPSSNGKKHSKYN